MQTFSDEMILYIGLIVASASILSAIAFYLLYKSKKKKLNARFDIEYGKIESAQRKQ